tara:strand:+ start:55 stop:249 length:195 start_codon:yes stop_codon:yes gene_type:complete
MKKIINLLVEKQDDTLRLDQFVNKYEKDLSRSKIKNLILKKNLSITINLMMTHLKKLKLMIKSA